MPLKANQESPVHVIPNTFSRIIQIYFCRINGVAWWVLLNPGLTLEVAAFTLPHQVPEPWEAVTMAAPPYAAFRAA